MAKNARNTRADAERVVKDLHEDFDQRIDMIREEIKKGPEAAESVERSLIDLRNGFENRLGDMRESLSDARESFDGAVENGRTTIRDRPLTSVGIAVVVGVLVGMIFGRRAKTQTHRGN
jgi:ElaB/YqjD/DUF883 family membrane-anchored ribosome-binding protein